MTLLAHVDVLACPLCDEPLTVAGSSLTCADGHSFDIARQGYVNLVPFTHRQRAIDGDTPEMLASRRRFHDAGHFAPLLDALADSVGTLLGEREASGPAVVVDAGCGDGYFIGGISAACSAAPETVFLGFDLSKSAVRMATTRYRDVAFYVADVNRSVCLRPGSVRVLLDVFAPRSPYRFARALEPGGSAIVVIPDPEHLASLREELGLIDIEPDKESRVIERFSGHLKLRERTELRYPLHLSADDVRDVVEMGPNHWHARQETPVGPAETEAAFVVLTLSR